MEDIILKLGEFGALGVISLILLTKGLSALKDLSDSNKQLADAVTRLSDKINEMDNRFVHISYRLDKLEQIISTLKEKLI